MANHYLTPLSRRAFFAVGAVATLTATQAELQATAPLRAGLIGRGMGGRYIMEAMAARGVEQLPLIATDRDWRALVQRRDLDTVFIATPDHLHAEMATEALHAGKHVFVLPPFVRTGEEARRLAALSRKQDRVLHVGMAPGESLRWAFAKAALAQTGEPRWIQANAVREETPGDRQWQSDRTRSHGVAARQIFNMFYPLLHHLDLGAPERATALGGNFQGQPGATPDRVLMTLRYGAGATVVLECGDRPKGPSLLRGVQDQIELPQVSKDCNLADELKCFATAISGDREESSARLRAACIAQEAVSSAMDQWARWESNQSA
jgi:predicted dehydrogenase